VLVLYEYGFADYVCVHLVYNAITSERYEFTPFQPTGFEMGYVSDESDRRNTFAMLRNAPTLRL
jgi:hypothetical protein